MVMKTFDANRRTSVVIAEIIANTAAELHPELIATAKGRVIFAGR
jgi:hypothetical protein